MGEFSGQDTLSYFLGLQVVGAATLVVEQKFIHGCSQVGRVEDVVVSDKYRGRQLGKLMVSVAIIMARKLDCYKVTLNCTDRPDDQVLQWPGIQM